MLPERIPDIRSARRQIADPSYKAIRIKSLREKLGDCYTSATNSKIKSEREFFLHMSDVYIQRIKWYLR